MTCNFLNAVVCLYGERLEEAIGYAEMVLDRRPCLEAMFIKGKALQGLNRYEEAMEMAKLIRSAGEKSDDKVVIDKKQYLFEAELNAQLGNPDIESCKQLLKLCPEHIPAYVILRSVVKNEAVTVEEGEEEENSLVSAFNNTTVSDKDFKEMIEKTDRNSTTFKQFSLKARKINLAEC